MATHIECAVVVGGGTRQSTVGSTSAPRVVLTRTSNHSSADHILSAKYFQLLAVSEFSVVAGNSENTDIT